MSHQQDISRFISDGKFDYGRVVRYYRKEIMHWTNATILADLLNEFLDDEEEVSERWVQRMEKDNKVPLDKKRRWLIATLLNIPPAYLGLTVTKTPLPPYDEIKLVIPRKIMRIDFCEYDNVLKGIWACPYQELDDTLIRIYQLEHATLFGHLKQKNQSGRLLCEYLMAGANIQRTQGYLDSAIGYLNDTIAISKEKAFFDLEAKAYYLRGYCHHEISRISRNKQAHQNNKSLSIIDSQIAVERLEEAKRNRIFVSSAFVGAAYEQYGSNLIYNVQDQKERIISLKIIDRGGRIITNNNRQDPYFFNITPEWYYIGKAQAYIGLGWAKSALKDLRYLTGDPRRMRRFLTANIAEAEAYVVNGEIETAVAYAEAALEVSRDLRSNLHIARIDRLYQSLRQNEKYTSCREVARLGVHLLQIQQPELFR